MTTGACQYRYNASEQYQMRGPGGGNESHCCAVTYPISDEPEVVPVTVRPDQGEPYVQFVRTGQLLPRDQADPFCPRHGGTPKPAAPVVLQAEVIQASERATALQRAYDDQLARNRDLEAVGRDQPHAAIEAQVTEGEEVNAQ